MEARIAVIVSFWIALSALLCPCGVLAQEPADANFPVDPAVDPNAPRLDVLVRDSFLPGIPVLVRVQIVGPDGAVDRDIWDAEAVLSVSGNRGVRLSPDRVTLRNGLGSSLVTITGRGDFELKVSVNGRERTILLIDWTGQPVQVVSGTLESSQTWSGVYRITGGDLTVPKGVTLTLAPGTLVLIDGVASGSEGTDIDVQGAIESLGAATSPVTFTALVPGRNWGELHHADAQPSTYRYTEIMQAGRSPKVGHSNSGPALRVSKSALTFDHASLTDNAGKIMHATDGSELVFLGTLFARSIMGPEIAKTSLLFEDGWIMEMRSKDDADGIYIHSQQKGQLCTLNRSVVAGADDDGIDTLGSDVVIENCILRGCKDKAVSVYGGETSIYRCLVVGNNLAPEDTTNASIVAKTFEDATATVNIDHTTVVATRTPGYLDVGLQSHNKYGVKAGKIVYNVTNSIVDATAPVHVQTPYIQSDIHISYSDVVGVQWLGAGNIAADPRFVAPERGDYRLEAESPCIGRASPDSDLADLGYYQFGQN